MPLSVLYRSWEEHGRVLPSESTVRRFLCANGLDARSLKAGRLENGPTKAFEASAPNDLWMVDFACGPTLRGHEDKVISTHLCLIVDDHSRLIFFAGYYTSADTAAFLDCLKQAVLRRGLPVKLYPTRANPSSTTTPKSFVPTSASASCTPSHAWSKGKVERLIQTIQRDFELTLRLDGNAVHSLGEFNTVLSNWTSSTYHLRVHSSTGQPRTNASPAASKPSAT